MFPFSDTFYTSVFRHVQGPVTDEIISSFSNLIHTGLHPVEGAVYAYIHGDGRIGVLAEINCETDFVARTDGFQELCKNKFYT